VVHFAEPEYAFARNKALMLDLDAIIGRDVLRARPSTLEEGMPLPQGVDVVADTYSPRAVAVTASAPGGRALLPSADDDDVDDDDDDDDGDEDALLDTIHDPPQPQLRKASRRFKPKERNAHQNKKRK